MSKISQAVERANGEGRMALAVYVTAGFPSKAAFQRTLPDLAAAVDVLEIGVPFSDPMADGVSIQHASFEALEQGVTLDWIFESLEHLQTETPIILMSYLNPLLAYGVKDLTSAARNTDVSGFIIPDLPYEESEFVAASLFSESIDLIQLVTPATPDERMALLCRYSRGFVYAVTSTGTTGGNVQGNEALPEYLDRVRKHSRIPVMAGFGIRSPDHIRAIAGHADGVVVGSAVVDALDRNEDALELVQQLRNATKADKEVSL